MAVFDLEAELAAVVAALSSRKIEHALCGALALAVHGHPRATKDIDLLVPGQCVAEARAVLSAIGFDLAAAPMTFRTGVTVHRVSRAADGALLTLDLIVAEGPLASAFASRTQVPWRGTMLSVVDRAGLVAMKRLADRPQDRADLVALGEAEE